ncbi:MAG: manganese efflux pump MntP, partial [Candidatus Marinimicrobia bacterium CG_4_9_14_3_um_filter_48_9]
MNFTFIFFISISLAMDAFAVSLASGFSHPKFTVPKALRMALFFGGFQAGMPLIGWYAGTHIQKLITAFDHWIAFILLALIGGHMIYHAIFDHTRSSRLDPFSLKILTGLAVATSIDALIVGVSLALIKTPILIAVAMIGGVTFLLSF